jgi:PAS domain S-box-containing protein
MNYKLEDLIDLRLCQSFLDKLNDLFSFPFAIVDNTGRILTENTWQDVCRIYHSVHPDAAGKCRRVTNVASATGEPDDGLFIYRCPNGLIEIFIPIMINGVEMGHFVSGQFSMSVPDPAKFAAQAEKFGFDKDQYLGSLSKVPVWSKEKVDQFIPMIKGFTDILSSTGLRNLQEKVARSNAENSEERYRILTESMKDVVWVLDTETLFFRYVSPSVKNLRGYTVEEVLNSPVAEAFLPEDFPFIVEGLRLRLKDFAAKRITEETYFTDEVRQPCKNGSWVMTEVITNYYINPETGHVELRGVTRDITPRKKVEEKLESLVERYNLAIKAGRFGIWDWDVINDKIVWDKRMYEIYEIRKDSQFIPYGIWAKMVHPQDLATAERESKRALEGGGDYDSEFRIVTPNGNTRYIKALGQVLRDPSGSAVRMTGINVDITDAWIAGETRRQSDRLFSTAFKWSPVALSISSTIDNKFVDVNETFIRDTGYTREEVLGKTSKELGLFADYRDRVRLVEKVRAQGYVYGQECRFRKKSGEIMSCLISLTNVTLQGQLYLLSTIIDITDRKNAEKDLLVAKERAEESDRLKTAFLANMSHEIRTPMNGILGFSELLKEEGVSPEDRQKFISIITKNSHHLLTMINDIIDVAKIDSNQLTISKVTFNLNQLLDRLFTSFDNERLRMGKNRLRFKVTKGLEDDQSYILCDDVRLQQILNNLLGNALKFTKEGMIVFGYSFETDCILFYVRDTGKGIARDKQEIIFERFRQEEETHTRDFGGTGLGLSISKGIVELLEGRMWVDSEEGKGSTFYFTLPLGILRNGAVSQTMVKNETRQFDFSNKNILVAEDIFENFELIRIMLKGTNANVLYAADGLQAVEACRNDHVIDAVLMDIRMPVMNGIEATREIRKFRTDLPIIALTAYAFTEDRTRCLEAGCSDFLTKPLDKSAMLEMFRALFS